MGHLEGLCWKKYPKKVPNRNKSNKFPSKKDENSNKNPEKRKCKDEKLFARSAVIFCPEINMTAINNSNFSSHISSLTSPIALFAYKNSWYYNIGVINYLCNVYNAFISYTKFTTPQPIESIGRSIMFLDIDIVRLNVQFTNQLIMPINLRDVYYIPFLIANLVSGSWLFKKSF